MTTPLIRLSAAAFALTFLSLTLLPAELRAAEPLTLALTPSRDPIALQEVGEAFARTLARLTGHPMRVFVASDYAGVVEALRSHRVDLAFVHPVGYVLANREAGCQILVRDIWQGRTAYTAKIFVRKEGGVGRLEDLRGKTIAFVDPTSTSGYIYPMALLIRRGLVRNRDPKTFFKDALFSGTHEAALRTLLRGGVDAAASFDKAPELHLRDPALIVQLSAVAETREIPEAGICVRPGLNAALVQKLKAALLSLTPAEHGPLLKNLYDIDGFVEAHDKDFETVRQELELVGSYPKR
jgi:phosphonate transport system substrate-binding protein